MSGLEQDTIGGYNSLIRKQKSEEGEAIISTVLFDDQAEVLHDRVSIDSIQPMTEEQYYRTELDQMKNEIYNFIIKFLQVDECEKSDNEWTKEEYQCVLEKYKEKVNQVNELLEKLNK